MKTTKLLFVCGLFSIAAGLSSCSKKSDTSPTISAGISASINGTATSFNTAAAGVKTTTTGTVNGTSTTLTGIAVGGKSSSGGILEIVIAAQTIKAGTTLKTINADDESALTGAAFIYAPNGDADNGYITQADNNSSVTITAITDTNVQGTFSGTVYEFDDNGNTIDHKTITNGKFNVNLTTISSTSAVSNKVQATKNKVIRIALGTLSPSLK